MRQWVCRRYGGAEVLSLEHSPKPTPGAGEVLIRIVATTVSSGDVRVRALRMPRGMRLIGRFVLGFLGPRRAVLGTELSGIVEAVGEGVITFKPGSAVIAFPGAKLGCHAEYRVVRADGPIALKPDGVDFESAAAICFGGSTALHFLRKAALQPGERLLVVGASGAVGSAMVQLAKAKGAVVTAVTSTTNVGLVRALGADAIIDYTDIDDVLAKATYDLIADTVGTIGFTGSVRALNESGRFLAINGEIADMVAGRKGTKRCIAGPAEERPGDVVELAGMAATGAFRPVVDSTYAFEDMAAAHRRTDSGRKRGSVVVRVSPDAFAVARPSGHVSRTHGC